MNKTVYPLVVGLLVVGMNACAMDNGGTVAIANATDAKEIVIQEARLNDEPASSTVQGVCHTYPVKKAYQKAMAFCKRHPICVALGVAVATAVIVYNVVPVVKQKVNALFGIGSTKQAEDPEIEAHTFPQEKIEASAIA